MSQQSTEHPSGTWSVVDGVRIWTPPEVLRLRPSLEFLITTGLVGGVFSLGILLGWVLYVCWMQPTSMDAEGLTLRRGGRIRWSEADLSSSRYVNVGTGGGGIHRTMVVAADGRRAFLWGLKGEWEAHHFVIRKLRDRAADLR